MKRGLSKFIKEVVLRGKNKKKNLGANAPKF
jgi:hypothetical protein